MIKKVLKKLKEKKVKRDEVKEYRRNLYLKSNMSEKDKNMIEGYKDDLY